MSGYNNYNYQNQRPMDNYQQQFNKELNTKLKAKGDCIAQAFFIGQIVGGINFSSDEGLFCELVLDVGPQWNMIRGAQQRNENSQNDFKSIQTQTAYAEENQMFVWSHPLDLEFKVGSVNGWQAFQIKIAIIFNLFYFFKHRPKGILKIWRLDDTNKIDIISYGVVNFPRQDGFHRLEVDTWSPIGDWSYQNFQFYLGTQPRLANLDLTKYSDKRHEMLGVSNGKVIFEIEVMLRNFQVVDVTGQENSLKNPNF
ncbi:hypothetical protein ABPG74_021015 [Tetrahymena malaccensis]